MGARRGKEKCFEQSWSFFFFCVAFEKASARSCMEASFCQPQLLAQTVGQKKLLFIFVHYWPSGRFTRLDLMQPFGLAALRKEEQFYSGLSLVLQVRRSVQHLRVHCTSFIKHKRLGLYCKSRCRLSSILKDTTPAVSRPGSSSRTPFAGVLEGLTDGRQQAALSQSRALKGSTNGDYENGHRPDKWGLVRCVSLAR